MRLDDKTGGVLGLPFCRMTRGDFHWRITDAGWMAT